MRKKRGDVSMLGTVAVIILTAVLLFFLISILISGGGGGRDNLLSYSQSNNALVTDQCNNFCDAMNGREGSSVIQGGNPQYLYCVEQRIFITDDDERERLTCAQMSQSGKLPINSCAC